MANLEGAYDLHVHCSPSLTPRKYSALGALRLASQAGMAGILLTDHSTETGSVAQIVNEVGLSAKAHGAIMLNDPVGGLHPSVVDAAIKLGARMVQMPTFSSRNHQERLSSTSLDPATFPHHVLKTSHGLAMDDAEGKLVPEVGEILDLVAEAGIMLATGHLSARESLLLAREGAQRGIRRVLINSTTSQIVSLTLAEQRELAEEPNVHFEHTHIMFTHLPEQPEPIEQMVASIREVGPRRCVISSDSGQPQNPDLVSALNQMADHLAAQGFTKGDLDLLLRQNPAYLLDVA